jgi:hypothetical protein
MTPEEMAIAADSTIFKSCMSLPCFGPAPTAVTNCDIPVMSVSAFI